MQLIPQGVRRHPIIVAIVAIVALPLLVFTMWAGATLNYTYSSGERAGLNTR